MVLPAISMLLIFAMPEASKTLEKAMTVLRTVSIRKLQILCKKYVAGKISAEKAISRIRWNHSRADQYCFKNERSLTLLKDRTVIVQYKDQDGRWKQ